MDQNQDFAGELGADFAAKREACEAARQWLSFLIDNPDKTVSVDEYRAQLKAAKVAHDDAHEAMLEAFSAPAPASPNETLDAFADWQDPAPKQQAGVPIPKDAVEAAAMAIYGVSRTVWDLQMPLTKERYVEDARNALQAAAPYLMAQAWDEGVDWVWEGGPDVKDDNPYRSVGAGG